MTTSGEEPGQRTEQVLNDIVLDADEYYNYLSKKRVSETRLDVLVVSLVVWFASFAVIGATTVFAFKLGIEYLVISFLVAIVIAIGAGLVTYLVRRRRGSKFAELSVLLTKMKQGDVSAEDGIRLMDAMHQARLVARKRKMDSAFEYGILAFALVALVGTSAGFGALAGVIVYLYFRFEALRQYEKEERKYEESKKELLQSL
jgi:hypothetical protein